jgi:hypothetical protein
MDMLRVFLILPLLLAGSLSADTISSPPDTLAVAKTFAVAKDTAVPAAPKADSSEVASPAAAIDTVAPDSLFVNDTVGAARRSPLSADTSTTDTVLTSTSPSDSMVKKDRPSPDIPVEDTVKLRHGTYLVAGFGWALGNFALSDYWESALPDSLANFGLADTAFRMQVDSTSTVGLHLSDTARLKFSIKEKPSIYTMSFPVSFSLVNITGKRRISISLIGSWMHKVYTATIGLVNDTTDLQCDYQQSFNVYSLFLSAVYGTEIPSEYFTIDGIEKCFFVCGIDCSPLIATTIATTVKAPDYPRLQEIKHHLESSDDRFFHGGSIALRAGLSMVKRINKKNATDAGFYYTIQGYGYFLEDGKRMAFNDIDPSSRKKDRPLFWISNRFELSIALLHYRN